MASASVNPDSTEILISGAGPAGLTLALALSRAGFETMLCDARPIIPDKESGAVSDGGRAYLVAGGCWRIFEALGVGEALRAQAERIEQVAADGGGGGIAFDGMDAGFDGPVGYVIEGAVLERVLGAAVLSEKRIEVRAPDRLAELEISLGGVDAVLASGAALRARLVVGCDGIRSFVRDSTGIAFDGWDYGHCAVSTVMTCAQPHEGRARQVFLPGGPIAALPMRGDRVNVVWSVKAAVADALVAMSEGEFEAELARQADEFLPGAKLDGPRGAFPLANRLASRFHGERVALAGDAAHVVHPLAGQGLNLGLKDVAALVDVICDAAYVGLDIGSEAALAPYTQWRRADVVSTAAAMEGLHRVFTAPGPVRSLAGMGMKVAGSVDGARRMFAKDAAGVLGDTPRLLREAG